MQRFCGVVASFLLVMGLVWPSQAGDRFVTIGTASELGVYYPAGGAICRLLKRGMKEHGIRCFVEPTSGTVYNLKAIQNGSLDLAIVQTDWLYHAYKGTDEFAADGPDTKLRSLFSLHTEVFTVLVRENSAIKTIRDIKGKRIGSVSDDGSGMRATAEEFLKAEGWDKRSFSPIVEQKPLDEGKDLCASKIDVALFTMGHPNGAMQEITHLCPTRLISVDGEEIDTLIQNNPHYVRVTIPGGMYPGSPHPVKSFGVKATVVTSSNVDADIIYQITKAVFDNLDNFKTLHPVFSTLDKEQMAKDGLVVPLHPGALRYYREMGIRQ